MENLGVIIVLVIIILGVIAAQGPKSCYYKLCKLLPAFREKQKCLSCGKTDCPECPHVECKTCEKCPECLAPQCPKCDICKEPEKATCPKCATCDKDAGDKCPSCPSCPSCLVKKPAVKPVESCPPCKKRLSVMLF